jgi:hypothetical protein
MRRTLLELTTLFFTLLLLEVDLGHHRVIAERIPSLALLPLIWLALSLLALIALQVRPSPLAANVVDGAMALAGVIGIVGFFAHLVVSGVTMDHLDRLFSSQVWGGAACPNWPIAITVAAVIGLFAARGAGEGEKSENADADDKPAWIAFVLVIAGIATSMAPGALAVSSDCLVLAALLLLALVVRDVAVALLARRMA